LSALNRRDLMRTAGVATLGTAAAGVLTSQLAAALQPSARMNLEAALANIGAPAALMSGICTLTPAAVEGPYYLNNRLNRQDISEGKPGLETWYFFLVVDQNCNAVPGAIVDLWHNDGLGVYSGFASQGTAGQTFIRGVQIADGNGLVAFKSIYPGWYPGRCTHLHLKVHVGTSTRLTSQTYFNDALSDLVHTRVMPYSQRGAAGRTRNTQDNIFNAANLKQVFVSPVGGLSLWAGMILAIP
jgi:protocatechuate 3,4-dioxygenase beta subunit